MEVKESNALDHTLEMTMKLEKTHDAVSELLYQLEETVISAFQ